MEINIKEEIKEDMFYLVNDSLSKMIMKVYFIIKIIALGRNEIDEIVLERLNSNSFVFKRAITGGAYLLRIDLKHYETEKYEYTNYKIFYQYHEKSSDKIETLNIVEFDKRIILAIIGRSYASSEVVFLIRKFLGIKTRRNWINWLYLKLSKVIKYI